MQNSLCVQVLTFSIYWQRYCTALQQQGQPNFAACYKERNYGTLVYDAGLQEKLECGPLPNVMVALPNIGGALCSTPQSLDDAHY